MNKSLEGKKLNIAMLGHKRIPSREGGIEIVVEELSTRMVQQGHSVTCYNRKGHHVAGVEFNVNNVLTYKGISIKTVFTIDKGGLAAMTSSVFGAIKSAFGKFDIIHFHAEGPCVMMWIPKLFGKRCIATIHGLDWKRAKWHGLARKYIKFGEKIATKYADEIIVLSEGVKQYFMDEYGRETVYIPNGVNKPRIINADEIERRWGLQKNSYILYLGRIVPEKGVQYLTNAFRHINTGKKLVIAGSASDTKEFYKNIQNNADNRMIFTGFVQGRLLEELYSNAYIYCLPSDLEGMPLSLLEAMSYGNCCLVSDILECTEVVEDKAVVFRKSDVSDLKEKLQLLCDDEKLVTEYKNIASDFICKKYSWDNVVDMTTALYCRG